MMADNEMKFGTTQMKKAYSKPQLISRGDVFSMTKGGFNAGSDAEMTGEFGGSPSS